MASRFDLAARLPGEAEMLAAVVANPAEDTAKLVYADWLDEHDDPRGAFLRKFIHAVRNGTDFPDDNPTFNASWLEMVGVELDVGIRELGLTEHRTAILARAKPAVALTATLGNDGEFPYGCSKFGGIPDLARGATWPHCSRGPLEFLAQFDLVELSKTVAGRALPSSGLLSFFMYHDYPRDEFGGPEGRGVPGGLQIIHTPGRAELEGVNPPEDMSNDLGRPHESCRLGFADALDLPDGSSGWPPFEGRLCSPLIDNASHQLFGYSHITVLAEDPTPGPEWEQFIGFSSDRELNWGWGDGHRLFWYIRSADLRNHRFGDTVAIDG